MEHRRILINHEALPVPATAMVVGRGVENLIVILDGTGQVVTIPKEWATPLIGKDAA